MEQLFAFYVWESIGLALKGTSKRRWTQRKRSFLTSGKVHCQLIELQWKELGLEERKGSSSFLHSRLIFSHIFSFISISYPHFLSFYLSYF